MSKLNFIVAMLLGAGSMLASAGSVHAYQASSAADVASMLEGPVSPHTVSRLEAGGLTDFGFDNE